MTHPPSNPPPGGPSGPSGPGRGPSATADIQLKRPASHTPVPSLDWRMGVQGGTWAANASGRTYIIGSTADRWWWATVDGHRLSDRAGQNMWGVKANAQNACAEHVADDNTRGGSDA